MSILTLHMSKSGNPINFLSSVNAHTQAQLLKKQGPHLLEQIIDRGIYPHKDIKVTLRIIF